MKATIVLPTYNEKENIENIINALIIEIKKIKNFEINILVVDDYSPDGTSQIVKNMCSVHSCIYLLMNNTRGLGRAYMAGFKHAIDELQPDVLIEMDSDFSHDPKKLEELLSPIKEGYDFVIGSRYIKGGTIPSDWGILRKLNSKYGNMFARIIAGLKEVHDCTSGFRAIKSDIIKKIDLDDLNANGYSFQMNILFESIQKGAKIFEIPINFVDRKRGKSKLGLSDIFEFIINSFYLRWKILTK